MEVAQLLWRARSAWNIELSILFTFLHLSLWKDCISQEPRVHIHIQNMLTNVEQGQEVLTDMQRIQYSKIQMGNAKHRMESTSS